MINKQQCQPRLVKGFRDILPPLAAQREKAIRDLEQVFQNFGYQPIDTPTLEYTDVLLSKSAGETEKQIFRFEDAGGRDVAMRFDLTVPFARFMAMHRHEVGLPFRRYHIGKAWRGENPQKGRYREFYQCDFDIVGSQNIQADLDVLLVAYCAIKSFHLSAFKIHINHRGLMHDILGHWNLQQQYLPILGILDKLYKIGPEKVQEELGILIPDHVEILWKFINPLDNSQPLDRLVNLCEEHRIKTQALEQIKQIFDDLEALGLGEYFVFSPCITRGLDYYTGIVFETFLTQAKEIGSVCSGGRYDNLVGLYSHENISGVGGSVGLDRLLAAMQEIQGALPEISGAHVLLIHSQNMLPQRKLQLALQEQGIKSACFPDDKKLDQQFRYAQSLGAHVGVFYRDKEGFILRNLHTRENIPAIDVETAILHIRKIIDGQEKPE